MTLPIGLHDRARDLARDQSEATGRTVTIGDVYTAAIGALTTRLDASEDIVFQSHPKGGVHRHSIRVPELAAEQSTRHQRLTTQSSFVATAMRHYLNQENTHG